MTENYDLQRGRVVTSRTEDQSSNYCVKYGIKLLRNVLLRLEATREAPQDVRSRVTGWEATHGGLGTIPRGNRGRTNCGDAIRRRYNEIAKHCSSMWTMDFEAVYGTSRLSWALQVTINSESRLRKQQSPQLHTLLLFKHWAHHSFVGAQGAAKPIVRTILC